MEWQLSGYEVEVRVPGDTWFRCCAILKVDDGPLPVAPTITYIRGIRPLLTETLILAPGSVIRWRECIAVGTLQDIAGAAERCGLGSPVEVELHAPII